MNKTELVEAIAKETGLTKAASEKAVKAFTDVVSKELKTYSVCYGSVYR